MLTRFLELDFRQAPEGGGDNPLGASSVLDELRRAQHIILLVHGYNNTRDEARASYDAFQKRQAALVADGLDWAFGATVIGVLWPGDARWGIARPAYYPWALPVADAVSGYLADAIRDAALHGTSLELDIIAHSLGNRLVLETLHQLEGAPGLTIRSVLHMAAAVPTSRLEKDGDDLRAGLINETQMGKATSVHSARDTVLSIWFPPGESVDIGAEGFMPIALGHQDWPGGESIRGFAQSAQDDLRHQDYWSRLDAKLVHDALQSPVSIAREIQTRTSPSRDTESVDLGETRSTPTRESGDSMS